MFEIIKKVEVVTNEVNLDEVIAELFGLLKDKTINMKCYITGKSAEAREGVWNQGSRKEIF